MSWKHSISGVFALLLSASAASAQAVPSGTGPAAQNMPSVLRNVGFEPQLNAHLPLDLAFRDETGRNVQLRDYFTQKPVLLALVYYGCPMLCNQTEQGVVGALRMLSFNPGRDYEVVFVSFDPRESPDMAPRKKNRPWRISAARKPPAAGISSRVRRNLSTRSPEAPIFGIRSTRSLTSSRTLPGSCC